MAYSIRLKPWGRSSQKGYRGAARLAAATGLMMISPLPLLLPPMPVGVVCIDGVLGGPPS